jgi:hypothetical protein
VLVPLPIKVPPQEPVYQYQLAPVPKEPPAKVKLTLVPLQTVVSDAVIEVGAVELVLTVIVTEAQVVVLQVP